MVTPELRLPNGGSRDLVLRSRGSAASRSRLQLSATSVRTGGSFETASLRLKDERLEVTRNVPGL
jgi:hypothetical protein